MPYAFNNILITYNKKINKKIKNLACFCSSLKSLLLNLQPVPGGSISRAMPAHVDKHKGKLTSLH